MRRYLVEQGPADRLGLTSIHPLAWIGEGWLVQLLDSHHMSLIGTMIGSTETLEGAVGKVRGPGL